MIPIDFNQYELWQNLSMFLLAAVIIWGAGSRLTIYADIIADRTGLGRAFIGVVLLATATSLPEIGRTITAASLGNAPLTVDSLFGGIVLQIAVLALADFTVAQRVLTFFAPRAVLLLQGALVIVLLGLAIAAMAMGEIINLFNVGLWSSMLFTGYVFMLYILKRYEEPGRWVPIDVPAELVDAEMVQNNRPGARRERSMRQIALIFGFFSVVIFGAGVVIADVGETVAVQTGLGASFVGATLLAFASALPEMSTSIAAVRLGAYSMAFSNIFGTNALLVALLFVGDIFYRQGPILEAVGRPSIFSAAMGLVATAVYLIGLIERRNQSYLGMGLDSIVVILLYGFTLVMLYLLR